MPNYYQWTDEELQIVRRDYRHTRQSTEELALRLGVTVNAVKGQVQRLGIASTRGRRRWTPEEDARLWELVPRYAMTTIAKKLGRGLNSVVVRSKRLGVTRRCRDGWYTMREVEAILAMDHRWIKARVDSGALKATRQNGRDAPGDMWRFAERDLQKFIYLHAHELHSRNVDLDHIVHLMADYRLVLRRQVAAHGPLGPSPGGAG